MAPCICWLPVPLISGFSGIRKWLIGFFLGCLFLAILLGLFSTVNLLFLMLGWTGLLQVFVLGRGSEVVIVGTLQLLTSSHVRETEREKALLRGVLLGGVWNGFLLGSCVDSLFHAGSVVAQMVTGIFCGNALFLLLLRSVKILSFMVSWEWIRVIGFWCLLWHGWLPLLSGVW